MNSCKRSMLCGRCYGLVVKVACLLDQFDILKSTAYGAGPFRFAEARNASHQLSGFSALSCLVRQRRKGACSTLWQQGVVKQVN
ncbi:hypothetical protein GQ54DRAFT_96539 [Martensiomyces pterosporus]|nr:hypothetical protein GQ54DRAFT_96539 [Martensiomyces pterosporus]